MSLSLTGLLLDMLKASCCKVFSILKIVTELMPYNSKNSGRSIFILLFLAARSSLTASRKHMKAGGPGKLKNPSKRFGKWYLLLYFGASGMNGTVDTLPEIMRRNTFIPWSAVAV
ncbi:hypothetical protein H5410_016897, partial [Solanum commersonii]